MTPVETPCRRICKQDRKAGFCIGWGRTVREVFSWIDLPDEERERIGAELPLRLKSLETEGR